VGGNLGVRKEVLGMRWDLWEVGLVFILIINNHEFTQLPSMRLSCLEIHIILDTPFVQTPTIQMHAVDL
jgi:hypothetical protein